MPLQLDMSRAFRTHDQLASLVGAVLVAAVEDESRAIEWKANYEDLTSSEASFAIARAILGMANRPVSVAQTAFEGVGYLLVGVEPTALVGQVVPDSAELLNAVRRYTGHGWPLWDPRSVTVDGKNVLIITIDPPRAGDRFALLQKSYQPRRGQLVPEGTVFVRQPGATERASRADLEMLQDRLLDGVAAEAKVSRAAERDREARTLVAELVHAGSQWADCMRTLIVMTTNRHWYQSDWIEWVNTDSGRKLAENAQTVQQNARKLYLLTHDVALTEPLRAAQSLMKDETNWTTIFGERASRPNERAVTYRRLYEVTAAFKRLEESAVALLSSPAETPTGRS